MKLITLFLLIHLNSFSQFSVGAINAYPQGIGTGHGVYIARLEEITRHFRAGFGAEAIYVREARQAPFSLIMHTVLHPGWKFLNPLAHISVARTVTPIHGGFLETGLGVQVRRLEAALNFRLYTMPAECPIDDGFFVKMGVQL